MLYASNYLVLPNQF